MGNVKIDIIYNSGGLKAKLADTEKLGLTEAEDKLSRSLLDDLLRLTNLRFGETKEAFVKRLQNGAKHIDEVAKQLKAPEFKSLSHAWLDSGELSAQRGVTLKDKANLILNSTGEASENEKDKLNRNTGYLESRLSASRNKLAQKGISDCVKYYIKATEHYSEVIGKLNFNGNVLANASKNNLLLSIRAFADTYSVGSKKVDLGFVKDEILPQALAIAELTEAIVAEAQKK